MLFYAFKHLENRKQTFPTSFLINNFLILAFIYCLIVGGLYFLQQQIHITRKKKSQMLLDFYLAQGKNTNKKRIFLHNNEHIDEHFLIDFKISYMASRIVLAIKEYLFVIYFQFCLAFVKSRIYHPLVKNQNKKFYKKKSFFFD